MIQLAVIEWAAAGWLGAMAAAVVPIVLHLRGRVAGPPIRFGAMRFLRAAHQDLTRRRRVHDRLLLAIRVAILVMLALAFARPAWRPGPAPDAAPVASVQDVVVILDVSASMQCPGRRGGSRFESAQRDAVALVRSLDPERHRVAGILAGAQPRPVLPSLSSNHAAVAGYLEDATPTHKRADLVGAIQYAISMSSSTAVHVFTDDQASQLEPIDETWPIPAARPFILHPQPHDPSTFNVAVHSPVQTPLEATRQAPWSVSVSVVAEGGPGRHQPIVITCALGDVVLHREFQRDPDAGEQTIRFEHQFAAPGVYPMTIRAEIDDAMAADNVVEGHVFVRGVRTVGLVAERDPTQDALQYLAHAITPDALSTWQWHWINAKTMDASQFEDEIALCDATVVLDGTSLDQTSLGAVYREIHERGGGVLWWLDNASTVAALQRFGDLDPARTLSPVTIEPLASIQVREWQSPGTDIGRLPGFDTLTRPAIESASLAVHASIEASPQAGIIMRDDRGEPVITWAPLGRGRQVVVNGSFDPDQNATMVREPIFAAITHAMLQMLSREPIDAPVSTVGRSARFGNALSEFDTPGAHVRTKLGDDGEVLLERLTIQIDPRESDIHPMTLASEPKESVDVDTRLAGTLAPVIPAPIHLWPWCVLATVLLVGAESILCARRECAGGSQ